MIKSFHGKYRFLSNFWPSPVEWYGVTWPTVEHAYQASKSFDQDFRNLIMDCRSPGVTKSIARRVKLREDWDDVIGTNLGGVYNVVHPLLMPMVQAHAGGRIVTVSSVSGITGNRGQTSYSAAKAGLIAFTKSLALEMAKRDILVNCVAPGFVESEMIAGIPEEEIRRMVPLRRAGKPAEVAGAVGFLFSDKGSYMTGQVLSPNGGLI